MSDGITLGDILNSLSKKELTDELCKREGVTELLVKPHQRMAVVIGSERYVEEGAATILVIK